MGDQASFWMCPKGALGLLQSTFWDAQGTPWERLRGVLVARKGAPGCAQGAPQAPLSETIQGALRVP